MSLDASVDQSVDVKPKRARKKRKKNSGNGKGQFGKPEQGTESHKDIHAKKPFKKARKDKFAGNAEQADSPDLREAPSKKDKIKQKKRPFRKAQAQKHARPRSKEKQADAKGNRPRKSITYSAIDLGTNNCRLLIARQTKSGFRVIDAFSRVVRLGEGVARDNRLSEEAMDRTIDALKVCAEKLARRNVTFMRHVATEACRIAENSDEFVARVKSETGINLDVISAGEEARLAVLGCQSLIAPDKKNALVFDIGGGSTELIWVKVRHGRANEIRGWMSVPWGVVNLTEEFSKKGKPPSEKKYSKMIETMRSHLQAFEDAHELSKVLKGRHTQFLGTSGTVTTLASLHLGLPKYNRDKVDGAWMKSRDIGKLSRRVAEMTPEERAAEPCIGTERADLVVAGCAILEAILNMWPVPSLRVADRGIREGILRGLMELDEPPRHIIKRNGKEKAGDARPPKKSGGKKWKHGNG